MTKPEPVAWRVRIRQRNDLLVGPWRAYLTPAKPNVNAPEHCEFEPLYLEADVRRAALEEAAEIADTFASIEGIAQAIASIIRARIGEQR